MCTLPTELFPGSHLLSLLFDAVRVNYQQLSLTDGAGGWTQTPFLKQPSWSVSLPVFTERQKTLATVEFLLVD